MEKNFSTTFELENTKDKDEKCGRRKEKTKEDKKFSTMWARVSLLFFYLIFEFHLLSWGY